MKKSADGPDRASGVEASPAIRGRSVVDETDRAIIEILSADSRVTNRSIAEQLSLPETTISARLRRLNERGIVMVTAITDWEAAGYDWAVAIFIRVEGRASRAVASDLEALDEIIAVALVHGGYDIVAHALITDRDSLRRLAKVDIPSIDGIGDISVNIVADTLKMRIGASGEKVLPDEPLRFPRPVVPMDEVDAGLIEALAADGRRSNRQIARELGVSEGTVRARLKRLEEAKLVHVVAVTNRAILNEVGSIAFIGVRLDGALRDETTSAIGALSEVYMLSVLIGTYDLLVTVVTATRDELTEFTSSTLPTLPGIRSTEVLEVSKTLKNTHRWARLFD